MFDSYEQAREEFWPCYPDVFCSLGKTRVYGTQVIPRVRALVA
jgi:hypothetical protein